MSDGCVALGLETIRIMTSSRLFASRRALVCSQGGSLLHKDPGQSVDSATAIAATRKTSSLCRTRGPPIFVDCRQLKPPKRQKREGKQQLKSIFTDGAPDGSGRLTIKSRSHLVTGHNGQHEADL